MEALDSFRRFALSVDIVNDNIKDQIVAILNNICLKTLGASFYEVQIRKLGRGGNYSYLETVWSNVDGIVNPIKTDGEYTGQTTFAFDKNIKLWVNEENGDYLNENSQCLDSWSEVKDLPKYWPYNNSKNKFRTSIILPLSLKGDFVPFGVVNFEFEKCHLINDRNIKIFENLAHSIAILTHSYDVRKQQAKNTKETLTELRSLTDKNILVLEKPKVFVAFPMNCEKDIIQIIQEISEEFSEEYDFVFWDSINKSGSIDEHLIEEITKSKFGIAYFSQLGDNGNYVDNPNVVFEAGMFHAMTSDNLSKEPVRWIPIREAKSGKKPFDFAHQRIIEIRRIKGNKIDDIEAIKTLISERLKEFD